MRFIPEAELGGPTPLTEEKLENTWGGAIQQQIDASVSGIDAALDAGAEPEVSESHATLTYGGGKLVTLQREAGRWVIRDME